MVGKRVRNREQKRESLEGGNMNTKKVFLFLVMSLLLISVSFAEITFSIRPDGVNLNNLLNNLFSADLGVSFGPVNPYVCFAGAYWSGSGAIDAKWWHDYFNHDLGHSENFYLSSTESGTGDASFMTLVPSVGIRLFTSSDARASGYLFGSVFKAFTIVMAQGSWTSKSYNTDGTLSYETNITIEDGKVTTIRREYFPDGSYEDTENEYDYSDKIASAKKLLSPIGGSVGIGADYKITDHLSVFGEFAIQGLMIRWRNEHEDADSIDEDPMNDWKTVIKTELQSLFGLTQAWIGLRFYY